MIRSSVDLPEPERPSRPTISPLRSDEIDIGEDAHLARPRAKPRLTPRTVRIGSPARRVTHRVYCGHCDFSIEAQPIFRIGIERPPQQAVEQGDEHRHDGDAERRSSDSRRRRCSRQYRRRGHAP